MLALYKGIRVDNGEWIVGNLSSVHPKSQEIETNVGHKFICPIQQSWQQTENGLMIGYYHRVYSDTICVFTNYYL